MNEISKRYIKAKRALFDKVYGEFLNPEQCKAVFTADGPLLVLAGAGSGKTTVLVNRIVYLIKYGNAYFSEESPEDIGIEAVMALEHMLTRPTEEIEEQELLSTFITEPAPPDRVLAITFTNKAAKEIKDRLTSAFSDPAVTGAVWTGTFHSVCMRILRRHADKLGYMQGFSIYDTYDQRRMINLCMKELEIDEKRLNARAVANEISRAKDSLIPPEEYEVTSNPFTRDILKIYELYQKKLREYNAVDFDDIIMKTVELFRKNPDILKVYQRKFRYVLVDEYQDTNHAQFVLTSLIADGTRNIMVVGDDDQSIYRFRGATVENILDFDKTYPDATVIKLEQNYRSTENILNAANAVISKNENRHFKKLWCGKGEGDKITLRELQDQNEEGRYIVDKINASVKTEGKNYSDFAVLYRTNALGRSLETTFAKSGIPYRILGDMGFYDRKEVKDMIAYLTVINSPTDNLRLKRIINEPKRKIGAVCVDAIERIASLEGTSMYDVIARCAEYTALSKNTDKLLGFCKIIESAKAKGLPPSELIDELFVSTGYKDMLTAEGFEGEGKIEIIEEFVSAAAEYEKRCLDADTPPQLSEFLEELALISDVDKYDETADAAVLMTVHSAKGLEFPTVFIAGMEESIFPSEQSKDEPGGIEEERRLAYVAITRAKDRLYITHAKTRMTYGKTCYNMLSRFVKNEIPESLIKHDRPVAAPPRANAAEQYYQRRQAYKQPLSKESERRLDMGFTSPAKISDKPKSFGVVRIPVGARVRHAVFGEGVILSSRDLGGDILYEVSFDGCGVKKLMATFAKLTKI